jgi:uncharacterized protein YkwD
MKWVVLGLALLASPGWACDRPAGADAVKAGLVDWINATRRDAGLGALSPSGKLDKAAAAHACDMAERGFFGHEGPSGPSFQRRLKKTGYGFSAAVENIAKSQTTSADKAAGIWAKSPPHMANILNPSISEVGLAVVTDGSQTYYVFVGGSQ